MNPNFMAYINSELLEAFKRKIEENNLDVNQVTEKLIRDYVEPKIETTKELAYFAKANYGIPMWAMKPDQNNHKVIRSYFKALKEGNGVANLYTMLYFCTHSEYRDTYIPPTQNSSEKRFYNTYNQLKTDSRNSNGKVFEDRDVYDSAGRYIKEVRVWDRVKDTLTEYKRFFGG